MSNSSQDDNIEKSLINEINNTSDYETNLQNIARIIADYFLVDFCLIISDLHNLRYFYKIRKITTNHSKISQNQISDLIQTPWVRELRNESKSKSISTLTHKKYQKLSSCFEKIEVKSLLGIGTNLKGETNGIIILGQLETSQWSQKDKKKIKEVANLVGIACHLSQVNTIIDEKNI
ncbi:MAG: GAF domain-containing protein, partial [Crocosphaera sp.]